MALIKCYECEKEISDSATSCPNCGAPVAKKQSGSASIVSVPQPESKKVSILLFIGIAILPIIFVWFLFRKGYSKQARIVGIVYLVLSVFILGRDHESTSNQNDATETAQVTESTTANTTAASDGRPEDSTVAEFSAQQIADAYEANTVAADRRFKNKWLIIKGKVEGINTDFTNSAYITFSIDNIFNSPQAQFIKSEEDQLANLRQGQFIKAKCIGHGDVAKTPMLRECTLVK